MYGWLRSSPPPLPPHATSASSCVRLSNGRPRRATQTRRPSRGCGITRSYLHRCGCGWLSLPPQLPSLVWAGRGRGEVNMCCRRQRGAGEEGNHQWLLIWGGRRGREEMKRVGRGHLLVGADGADGGGSGRVVCVVGKGSPPGRSAPRGWWQAGRRRAAGGGRRAACVPAGHGWAGYKRILSGVP